MLDGGASATLVSRPTHVPSQKTARRFGGRGGIVCDGMAMGYVEIGAWIASRLLGAGNVNRTNSESL
jgi:hypothetical protein